MGRRATPASVRAFLLEELTTLPEPLTGAALEEGVERTRQILEAAEWKFATSMPDNPHWYTLAKTWENLDSFYDAVAFIRVNGTWTTYKGWPYIELHTGDFFYWSMGWPVEETELINRKRRDDLG